MSAAVTAVGLPAGDLGAILSAAAVPLLEATMAVDRERSWHNVGRVLDDAVATVGMSPEDATAWIGASDSRLMLTRDVVQAALTTLDERWVQGLSRVLAEGMADDAKIDLSRLIALALRDLEPAHVTVMHGMLYRSPEHPYELREPEPGPFLIRALEWSFSDLMAAFPNLASGMPAILAGLERHGLILSVEQGRTWCPSGFAVQCDRRLMGLSS